MDVAAVGSVQENNGIHYGFMDKHSGVGAPQMGGADTFRMLVPLIPREEPKKSWHDQAYETLLNIPKEMGKDFEELGDDTEDALSWLATGETIHGDEEPAYTGPPAMMAVEVDAKNKTVTISDHSNDWTAENLLTSKSVPESIETTHAGSGNYHDTDRTTIFTFDEIKKAGGLALQDDDATIAASFDENGKLVLDTVGYKDGEYTRVNTVVGNPSDLNSFAVRTGSADAPTHDGALEQFKPTVTPKLGEAVEPGPAKNASQFDLFSPSTWSFP